MKKILSIVLTAALAFLLVACGSKEGASSSDAAQAAGAGQASLETITPGKLTVATSPDFAPWEFYSIGADKTPVLSGVDMSLAKYIADYAGLELEIIPMDFDGVLTELATGSVDLGLAGLSPDPKRQDAMSFSDVYYTGGQAFVSTQDKADAFGGVEDANRAGVSVGAQIGAIQMDLATQYTPDADIVPLPKVTDIISELISGKLDGAFIETTVAESYQKNYPQLTIVCEVPYDVDGFAVGVNKSNEALLKVVNEAVAAAKADGSIGRFVTEANELAAGETYEGLLDESGNVQ